MDVPYKRIAMDVIGPLPKSSSVPDPPWSHQFEQESLSLAAAHVDLTECFVSFRRDVTIQVMEQTLKLAEKNLGEMCSILASYTRKKAKLRDRADLLVAQLFDFSSTEDLEFQTGLKNLAEDLAMVQDYRQAQVDRLETKVVAPLKAYGDIVKNKKVSLQQQQQHEMHHVSNQETSEERYPTTVRPHGHQRNTLLLIPHPRSLGFASFKGASLMNGFLREEVVYCVYQAELNLQQASTNAQRSITQLEDTIMDFQRQKLLDIKTIFINFITVEMSFYAKALEVYTHTYLNLEAMDTQKDLQLFSARIKIFDPPVWSLDSQSSPPTIHYSSLPPSSSNPPNPVSVETSGAAQSHALQRGRDEGPAPRPHSNLQHQADKKGQRDETDDDAEEEEEEEEDSDEDMKLTGRRSYAVQYVQMCRSKQ
ncbi:protein FAM92B-like [Nothobranchius furzeri]|uniref:Protein FAM92B-like n=1 Tax=Nothobranchius furzeri TaxID=105023 RepID=A0A9D2Y3K3_NOTFU|nr:protein FAM92B-like [Nothobranchius furzeri]